MPLIFSYGTLQLESVQLETFGRRLSGQPDELPLYETSAVRIEDPKLAAESGRTHNANIIYNGRDESTVMGMAFEVTEAELATADRYEEPASYKRILVSLRSGKEAWVYLYARGARKPPPAEAAPWVRIDESEIVKQFQARRRRTWRLTRHWIVLAAIGFAGSFYGEDRWDEFANLVFFLFAFAGIAITVLIVRKHYRCPGCEDIVWTDEGVSLSPTECPHCNARLA